VARRSISLGFRSGLIILQQFAHCRQSIWLDTFLYKSWTMESSSSIDRSQPFRKHRKAQLTSSFSFANTAILLGSVSSFMFFSELGGPQLSCGPKDLLRQQRIRPPQAKNTLCPDATLSSRPAVGRTSKLTCPLAQSRSGAGGVIS
jgi:hypothetical protein